MKKILLSCLLGCLLVPSHAQVNIDSLRAVWRDDSQPDTSRLQALGTFIWQGYLSSQPDSAYYFAQFQLEWAREKGLRKYEANALTVMGEYYQGQGNYTKALSHHGQSLVVMEKIGDILFRARR